MPKSVTPLNDALLKNLKPQTKDYIKTDGNGLRILVKTSGTKLWEFEYTSPTLKKRRKTSFGNYPQTTLVMARNKRDENIKLIRSGIDPLEQKQIEHDTIKKQNEIKNNTFQKVALEWHDNYSTEVSLNYHYKLLRALQLYIFPFIKNKPISEITRKDIITILQELKNKSLVETANRTLMILNKIYMYAVTLEYAPHNIIADIDKKVLLGKIEKVHYPTFTKIQDIKGLLLSIDEYQGEISTQFAMKLLPYVFVRSFNIRNMTWDEIDFQNKEWIIPANKMKTNKEFILPLPLQAIRILENLKKLQTNDSIYVFVGIRSINSPISDNTLISALRRMGYTKDQIVPHSFRSIFSTIAYENMPIHGYSSEVIEALLAHQETNKVKEAYNRATYKEQMRNLIQWYANWLDNIKK
ncbi:tyrosine-type recombinase/integrase [Aliarcobacter butzleri]|uniref:tyrosine-type recombinase/integrase n=1 Tax=Aliarcobacter butzleri TaxID=28197 RepID=UPI0024DE03EE|nr:tyrosine-type recombinase/integrase [Aliarcobacter butzleri]MDK2050888.1 tyrosine-type recombinase/integrase [Aliarcobacter butzleri]